MHTVLLVEDNPVDAQILTTLLRGVENIAVKHTADGDEAMQLAQAGEVTLILLDVLLPDTLHKGISINGIELARLLRSDPQTAELPIILVTAHGDSDRDDFLRWSGANGYFSKPITDHQAFIDEVLALLPVSD